MKPKIGFIGLGLMGRPMVAEFIEGWISGDGVEPHAEQIGGAGESGSDGCEHGGGCRGASGCTDHDCERSCCAGIRAVGRRRARGVAQGQPADRFEHRFPGARKRVAAACAERGVEFLDAPVTGGTWGAEKGELVFMVGGEAARFARVEPVLGAMGKKWFHLGPNGAGQIVKLAMNLILALEVQALAEAMALVAGAGVPAENLLAYASKHGARARFRREGADDFETGLHAEFSAAADAQGSGIGARPGESDWSAAARVCSVARNLQRREGRHEGRRGLRCRR